MRALFAIPGDLSLPTGGYAYDRALMAHLPGEGIEVVHLPLPAGFPRPSARECADTEHAFQNAPAADAAIVDGLAYGVLGSGTIAAIRAPIIALVHHPLAYETGLGEDIAASFRQSEQAALDLAHAVLVTSRETARILETDFGVADSRITIAEPGTARAARARGSGGGPVQLLAVGSLVPRKGYDVLIAALERLRDLDWRLTIAGADDRDPATAAAIREAVTRAGFGERVSVPGALRDGALEAAFASADVFVMASHYEGYGMALAEALARGLPVVTTDSGAAAAALSPEAGLRVPTGEAALLSDALRRVIADAGLRARLAEGAWRLAATLPGWGETARIVAALIRKVAA